MSGLQLAKGNDTSAPAAPAAAPPPLPETGPQSRDVGSHTQESYSLPTPGAAPGAAPPPPPPPPPPAAGMQPVAHRHTEVLESSAAEGRKLGGTLLVVVILGLLGGGGWYLYQHPELFGKKPVARAVSWPAITLTGMADTTTTGDVGSAILNGNLVAINHRIDGVTLVGIASDGVTLELGGETRFIRIGESTL